MFQDIELEFDELRDTEEGNVAGGNDVEEDVMPNDDEILAKFNEEAKKAGSKVAKARKPLPKFDAMRLCGPRGIVSLPSYFDDFKVHGKGEEFNDLNEMMKRLEHWAHRLFPQMPFDEALIRLEKLGTKKPVQNSLERIRNDEAVVCEDPHDDKPREDSHDFNEPSQTENPFQFDDFDDFPMDESMLNMNKLLDVSRGSSPHEQLQSSHLTSSVDNSTVKVSDEQRRLIEEKRQRALQIREEKQRLSLMQQSLPIQGQPEQTQTEPQENNEELLMTDDDILTMVNIE